MSKNSNADVIHLMQKKYVSNKIRDGSKRFRYQNFENNEDFLNHTINLNADSHLNQRTKS